MDNEIHKLRQFLIKNMATKDDISGIKADIKDVKQKLSVLQTSVDNFAKQRKDVVEEAGIKASQVRRIENWIKKAATKIGVEYNP